MHMFTHSSLGTMRKHRNQLDTINLGSGLDFDKMKAIDYAVRILDKLISGETLVVVNNTPFAKNSSLQK